MADRHSFSNEVYSLLIQEAGGFSMYVCWPHCLSSFYLPAFFIFFFFLLQMSPVTSKSGDLKFSSEHDTDRDSPATQ